MVDKEDPPLQRTQSPIATLIATSIATPTALEDPPLQRTQSFYVPVTRYLPLLTHPLAAHCVRCKGVCK